MARKKQYKQFKKHYVAKYEELLKLEEQKEKEQSDDGSKDGDDDQKDENSEKGSQAEGEEKKEEEKKKEDTGDPDEALFESIPEGECDKVDEFLAYFIMVSDSAKKKD